MRLKQLRQITIFFLFVLFSINSGHAQTNEQQALEAKRARLQQEIKQINKLLFAEKKEKGDVLEHMQALDKRINVRQQLIRVTNQQSNLLNRQINANVRSISKLKQDLTLLKEEYATLIRKTYQNRTQQNRVLFLLSSQNFFQAFKRAQYMKQYTNYRKEQGQELVAKTNELTALNESLVV